jgi:hypothetical protein
MFINVLYNVEEGRSQQKLQIMERCSASFPFYVSVMTQNSLWLQSIIKLNTRYTLLHPNTERNFCSSAFRYLLNGFLLERKKIFENGELRRMFGSIVQDLSSSSLALLLYGFAVSLSTAFFSPSLSS